MKRLIDFFMFPAVSIELVEVSNQGAQMWELVNTYP